MDHCYVRFQTCSEISSVNFCSVVQLQVLPGGEYFLAVGTGVAVVLDTLVDDLDVSVQVTFLAEHFVTLRTCRRFVNLDV